VANRLARVCATSTDRDPPPLLVTPRHRLGLTGAPYAPRSQRVGRSDGALEAGGRRQVTGAAELRLTRMINCGFCQGSCGFTGPQFAPLFDAALGNAALRAHEALHEPCHPLSDLAQSSGPWAARCVAQLCEFGAICRMPRGGICPLHGHCAGRGTGRCPPCRIVAKMASSCSNAGEDAFSPPTY